jgi:hypothetical protein
MAKTANNELLVKKKTGDLPLCFMLDKLQSSGVQK